MKAEVYHRDGFICCVTTLGLKCTHVHACLFKHYLGTPFIGKGIMWMYEYRQSKKFLFLYYFSIPTFLLDYVHACFKTGLYFMSEFLYYVPLIGFHGDSVYVHMNACVPLYSLKPFSSEYFYWTLKNWWWNTQFLVYFHNPKGIHLYHFVTYMYCYLIQTYIYE